MSHYWPIILIVTANVFYHICSKQTPDNINPLASLTVTYAVAAVFSGILYFVLNRDANLAREYSHLTWTSFILGVAIVGLEAGCIYMYKLGWNVNSGQLLYSSILAIVLFFIGYFLYHETITATKAVGVVICLVGLYLINK